jgi:hypothetical protein
MPSKTTKKRVALFIRDYGKDIVKAINNKNFYFEAVVAQKCMESAYGDSKLVKEDNNFFGVTSPNGGYYHFESPLECFSAYVELVQKKYSPALSASSPEDQLLRMAESGYIDSSKMSPAQYVKICKPAIDAARDLCGIGKIKNADPKEWEFAVVRNPSSELIEKVTVKQIK